LEIAAHIQGEDNRRVNLNNNVDVFSRASTRYPMIPTSDELQYAISNYLAIHRKELLECKVERILKQHGHEIVWTLPYSPDLQPIELFWAAGKNHVANNHKFGRKMKEVVELLREGWYGAKAKEGEDDEFKKKACRVDHFLKKAIY
jgi:DDE superfamily endonuclease